MPVGRPTGSQNANRRMMQRVLTEKYPEYQPVVRMAGHAIKLDEQVDDDPHNLELRVAAIAAHDKVANFLTPRLKAIEITGEDGGPIRAILSQGDAKL